MKRQIQAKSKKQTYCHFKGIFLEKNLTIKATCHMQLANCAVNIEKSKILIYGKAIKKTKITVAQNSLARVKTKYYQQCKAHIKIAVHGMLSKLICTSYLSHNNPCFRCNTAITYFLVLHMCEIRFRDVIDRTMHLFTSWRKNSETWPNEYVFGPLFFNSIRWFSYVIKKIWLSLTVEMKFY